MPRPTTNILLYAQHYIMNQTPKADRELLKLAAKAGGYSLSAVPGMIWSDTAAEYIPWDPLADDGDALRLAVRLGLSVYCPGVDDETAVARNFGGVRIMELVTEDPHAATRRAIVRAAAEIGRAMP